MLKETVTYKNLDGVEVSKELYFNISTSELTELDKAFGGNAFEKMSNLSENNSVMEVVSSLNNIILIAYGERTPEGDGFIKNDEVRNRFKYSLALEAYISLLLRSPEALERFRDGLVSQEVLRAAAEVTDAPEQPKLQAVKKAPTAEAEIARLKAEHPELFK